MKKAGRNVLLLGTLSACGVGGRGGPARLAPPDANPRPVAAHNTQPAPRNDVPLAHVFVALCVNVHQGIVPVAPHLGDGDDPAGNLY